jgi:hypothetical protein
MNMKQIIQFIKKLFIKKQAQADFADWEKRVKRVGQLNPKDRNIYYEEEQEKWKSWHGE